MSETESSPPSASQPSSVGAKAAESSQPKTLPTALGLTPPTTKAAATASRTRRNGRIIRLSVIATTLLGGIWAAMASSLIETGRTYASELIANFQGGAEIARLRGELDALLAKTSLADTAYVVMNYRNQQFCYDEVKRWADEKSYAFVPYSLPNQYSAVVDIYQARLQLRCVGRRFVPATFLVIAGTQEASEHVNIVHKDLSQRFSLYDNYPAVVSPKDPNWTNSGPFVSMGFVTFELPYADYLRWQNGTMPQQISTSLLRPGSIVRISTIDSFSFFTLDDPGSTITIRSPESGFFQLLGADGTWQNSDNLLLPGTVPFSTTPVRTSVLVSIAAMNYGRDSSSSDESRYLGEDAASRIAAAPGVIDGGRIKTILRNW